MPSSAESFPVPPQARWPPQIKHFFIGPDVLSAMLVFEERTTSTSHTLMFNGKTLVGIGHPARRGFLDGGRFGELRPSNRSHELCGQVS